ncbi:hypothetical protein GALL_207630 [mine drainage metagenome]|uniref:Uncharacterized protein n=1 Tax=mine drainage metagenome TaxID=410659 RepID=A0A1J5RNA3_9ZZZZ
MSFQTQVNATPAPAVAGDFASTNPRASVLAGPGGLVAAAGGVTVGCFAWLDTTSYTTAANAGSGQPDGFVRNSRAGLITAYGAEASLVIPAGFPVELFNEGDFWARNAGTAAAVPGQKVFAGTGTGQVACAATGTALAGFVETTWVCRSAGAVGELVKISSRAQA